MVFGKQQFALSPIVEQFVPGKPAAALQHVCGGPSGHSPEPGVVGSALHKPQWGSCPGPPAMQSSPVLQQTSLHTTWFFAQQKLVALPPSWPALEHVSPTWQHSLLQIGFATGQHGLFASPPPWPNGAQASFTPQQLVPQTVFAAPQHPPVDGAQTSVALSQHCLFKHAVVPATQQVPNLGSRQVSPALQQRPEALKPPGPCLQGTEQHASPPALHRAPQAAAVRRQRMVAVPTQRT